MENAPFLVTKLKIQVLPCVLAFTDGISADRIIGFEGLGNSADTFTAQDLEARLLKAGVVTRPKVSGLDEADAARRRLHDAARDEDEDDWD